MAKEREDVNKLVSDLIGGGAAPASSSKSPTPKVAAVGDSPAKEPQKQSITPGSVGRSRPVKHLVVDQLAPVNIRPRVSTVIWSVIYSYFVSSKGHAQ